MKRRAEARKLEMKKNIKILRLDEKNPKIRPNAIICTNKHNNEHK